MYKILFLNSMVLGTLISISSYSWLSMWMGLEINLLSIIPLFSNNKNIFSSESALKYFITQAMASLILLMAILLLLLTNEFIHPLMNSSLKVMMDSALLTKLGAAPFHFWFPEVIEGLNWTNSFILLTWQKIAPMILLMNNKINSKLIIMMIVISLTISTISGMNQMSIRKILAYSSINHIAWMLSTLMISLSTWLFYFLIYWIINMNIVFILNSTKTFFVNQMNNILLKNKLVKFTFMTNLLSLGGLPPFLGFLPKWLVINWLVSNQLSMIALVLIIFTLIMTFIYTRLILSSLTISMSEMMTKTEIPNNIAIIFINTISLLGLLFCTFSFNLM
ncbi:NADH dehydrogenase subunit 2 (mitochondrion) [Tribolium castaneum]|uniref:NADH-ubiquinone oxidoreductase chain 2 n=1 Tax=Tribolium castaneum TaxID=7070 RepID=Q94R79_TRICA|nr:NADH dehydrogenase subunit 2 [Tribolium castaneum]CAC51700.1 NADH dehydrogenase subunit 2 [Tribolium castaneum]|eukprot:NP_203156.1 NADH dehydrogenase subunit 2 (mitochondrion) [Tribolium castaneum]